MKEAELQKTARVDFLDVQPHMFKEDVWYVSVLVTRSDGSVPTPWTIEVDRTDPKCSDYLELTFRC